MSSLKRKLRVSLGERFVRTASKTFSWFCEGYKNAREEFMELVNEEHCDIRSEFLGEFCDHNRTSGTSQRCAHYLKGTIQSS